MDKILHIKKRRDFLRVAEGIRMVVSTVILQAAPNLSDQKRPFRVGYTTTKKIGKAVVRNRTRRRLRAAVQEVFPSRALENVDYVLIGRYNTSLCSFKELKSDIKWALKKANAMIEKGILKSPPPPQKVEEEQTDEQINEVLVN